ncbi:MAG: magnesium-dependent phosphatase-1 [Planctomycetota bacterium]
MRYRLFVFDLDETLWTIHHKTLDPVRGPFELIGSHEAESSTARVQLFPGVRALLRNLERRGKFISLASRSDPDVCEELLAHFDIRKHFQYAQFGWQEKGAAVLNVIRAFHDIDKETIAPAETLFVDDYPANIEEVRGMGASTLLFGRDVRSIQELSWMLA